MDYRFWPFGLVALGANGLVVAHGGRFLKVRRQRSGDFFCANAKKMMLAKHPEKTNFIKIFKMNTSAQQTSVAESYFESLRNLNADTKLDLISKLSQSLKKQDVEPVTSVESLFGAYLSDETAEEIIAGIRASRLFTRNIETL